MSIPEGWYGKIHARSGNSHKKHTDVIAGVIDADYRGEVSVLMFNHSNKSLTFCTGDKVAQITFQEAHAPGKPTATVTVMHHGVACDRSGMDPIVGTRYHLPGQNYDLCQAEWDKLPPQEQATYERIERPGAL